MPHEASRQIEYKISALFLKPVHQPLEHHSGLIKSLEKAGLDFVWGHAHLHGTVPDSMIPILAILRRVGPKYFKNRVLDVLLDVSASLVVIANLVVPQFLEVCVAALQLFDGTIDFSFRRKLFDFIGGWRGSAIVGSGHNVFFFTHRARCYRAETGSTRTNHTIKPGPRGHLRPHPMRDLGDQTQFVALSRFGDRVALPYRAETALRRKSHSLAREVAARFLDSLRDRAGRLEFGAFGRDETQHDALIGWDIAQRLERPRTPIVIFQKKVCKILRPLEDLLRDRFVAALADVVALVVTAA